MKTLAVLVLLGAFCCVQCSPARRIKRAVIPGLPDSVLNATQIKEILDGHNTRRASEGAANMIKLEWSDELAAMSQWLANECRYEHDWPDSSVWRPHVPTSWVYEPGQNVYALWGGTFYPPLTLDNALQAFYREKEHYVFANDTCNKAPCGHYTQLVWWDNTHVGCGINQCQTLPKAGDYAWVLVCNYGPGGNWLGERPFTAGQACSMCPSAYPHCTSDGLCSAEAEAGCGPSEQVGGHTLQCLKDLWTHVGCWQAGTSYPSSTTTPSASQHTYWQSLSVLDARTDMAAFHLKAARSITDNNAGRVEYQEQCFGPDFLKNCAGLDDPDHGDHSVQCMRDAWAVAGCTDQGSLYPQDANANSGWWHTQTVRGMIKDMYVMSTSTDQTMCRGH